jgi:hypothetical protein
MISSTREREIYIGQEHLPQTPKKHTFILRVWMNYAAELPKTHYCAINIVTILYVVLKFNT